MSGKTKEDFISKPIRYLIIFVIVLAIAMITGVLTPVQAGTALVFVLKCIWWVLKGIAMLVKYVFVHHAEITSSFHG